ncbi:nucleotidyltransferase family protein [Sabulicella rubraurantiaca]|uniref:nucleotidyltransferase family protein n=1 Tax=Sabulicella rubraurantiaca TaxID=2811429 RepID=UPI001A971D3B|nr:nucleotidyltransferase family protein [Sabulicella rubraurantiaca]
MIPAEAVVLAGGLGTRLRPVVSDVPKPLAPVAGRPFLFWLLEALARQGIARVVLANGYMGDRIEQDVGPRFAGMNILHVREEVPLGTGGALWAALGQCREDRVFALNGDTWLGVSLAAMAEEAPSADLVLAVRRVEDRSRFGSMRLDGNRVLGLAEKGASGEGLVNGGVYLLRRDLPERRPMPEVFNLETGVLAEPGPLDVRAHVTQAPFLDIGTPEDHRAAQTLIPAWAAGPVPRETA